MGPTPVSHPQGRPPGRNGKSTLRFYCANYLVYAADDPYMSKAKGGAVLLRSAIVSAFMLVSGGLHPANAAAHDRLPRNGWDPETTTLSSWTRLHGRLAPAAADENAGGGRMWLISAQRQPTQAAI